MLLTRTGQCLHQLLEAEVAVFMSQGWEALGGCVEVELKINCINYLLPYGKQPRRGDCPLYHSPRQLTNNILLQHGPICSRNCVVRGVVGKETHLVVVVADDGQVAKDGRANLET